MFDLSEIRTATAADELAGEGYWPALAVRYFSEGKYSRVVELCREHLEEESIPVAARLVYARALWHGDRAESSTEQLYAVLARDPDNLVALKYLGDIKFAENDEHGAISHYKRILEIDPGCRSLCSDLKRPRKAGTRTINLTRREEKPSLTKSSLRKIPFYTETIADLYMNQGYPRMAAEVYRVLNKDEGNPRLSEKLLQAEHAIKAKE